jgi:regulator of RNase E activity RraA
MTKITPKTILNFNKADDEDKVSEINRVTVENILDTVSSDNVSDAMKNLYGKHGLVKDVKPLNPKHKVAGFIKTVETNSNDWGTGIKAIYDCKKDEILFIKCSDNDYAIWGGLASASAQKHGVQATVIVGSSRDTSDILELDFPVFSQKIQSRAGLPLNKGTIGEDIIVDESIIKTGDFIICDVDGVVVVPKEHLEEVIEEVNRIKLFETDCVKKIFDENKQLDEMVGF